jgi:hypothetical protein
MYVSFSYLIVDGYAYNKKNNTNFSCSIHVVVFSIEYIGSLVGIY